MSRWRAVDGNRRLASGFVALAAVLSAGAAAAGPTGGVVKAGAARVETRGAQTTVTQATERVVIDWKSFDIDADESIRFLQPAPGAVALNRVLDGLPTHIRGALQANGNVWIVNRNGVVLHAGATADVGGLLATTADISNADFMAGNYRFDQPGASDARIVNEGEITFGEAGLAAFVAPGVANRGVISGKLGKVVIAGAETFAVDLGGDGLYAFAVQEGAAQAATTGRIDNPGGYILITAASARGLVESQVSVGGVVEARTAESKAGRITLSGGDLEIAGTVEAIGRGVGETGGAVEIVARTVRVAPAARVDVSGDAGGGAVRVGGDPRGGTPPAPTARVAVARGAAIRADATGGAGDGGSIVVWSGEATAFSGSMSARGGARSGDGGFVEISSAGFLDFTGQADLSAPGGAVGRLLLDPADIVIGAVGAQDSELADFEILFGDLDGGLVQFTLSAAALSAVAADVTLQATNDITINAAVSTGFGLTLQAGNDIVLNADLTAAALTLAADFDFSAFGGPASNGAGTVVFSGGALSASDIALSSGGVLALGPLVAADALTVIAGGAITQFDALTVGGSARFDAGVFDVTLTDAANAFGGRVDATGAAVALTGIGALALGSIEAATLDVFAGGAISDTAGAHIVVAGDAAFAASSGGFFDIALDNDALADRHGFGGVVSADGRRITLIAADGLALGAVSAGGALRVAARGGSIDDGAAGAVSATLSASFDATGDILLGNGGHAFGGAGATFLTGGDAVIAASAALRVFDSAAGGAVDLTANGGGLIVSETTGDNLTGRAAGAIEAADLRVNALTLGGAGTTLGTAVAAAGAVSMERGIVGAGGVAAASAVEVSLTDMAVDGAVTVRAPVQRYAGLRAGAFAAGPVDFNAAVAGDASNINLITLDQMTFVSSLTASAGQIGLGFLRTLSGGDLTLTALTGDLAKLPDGGIGYAAATDPTLVVALGRDVGFATSVDPDGAFADLVFVGGDAALTAAGDVALGRGFAPGGAVLQSRIAGVLDLDAAAAAIEVADGLILGTVDVKGDTFFRFNAEPGPGASEALTQAAGAALHVSGRLDVVGGMHSGPLNVPVPVSAMRGDIALTSAANRFGGSVSLIAEDAALLAAAGFAIKSARLSGSLDAAVASDNAAEGLSASDLVITGAAAFRTAGAVVLNGVATGGALSVESRAAYVDARDVASGATSVTAAGALTLTDATLGDAALVAAQDVALSRVTAGALSVESRFERVDAKAVTAGDTAMTAAGALVLSGATLADAALTAGGAATLADVDAGALTIDAATLALSRAKAATTRLRILATASVDLLAAGATAIDSGALSLTRTRIDGALTMDAGGDAAHLADLAVSGSAQLKAAAIGGPGGAASRIAIGGGLDADSDAAATFSDLSVGGVSRIAAGGAVRLDDVALGDLRLTTGGRADLSDGRIGDLTLTARQGVTLRNHRLGALDARSATGLDLGAIRASGRATLLAEGGDIALGAVEIGGDLIAVAPQGGVFTQAGDPVLAAVVVDAPSVLGGRDIALAAARTAGLLTVGGDAHFLAAGEVALVDDGTLRNDFRGGVTVVAGGNVALDDVDNLIIGAARGVARPDDGVIAFSGVSSGGTLRVEAGASISDADGPRAAIIVPGDALFLAGDGILLDNGVHAIGGGVAASGRDVTLSEAGSIDLGPVTAAGDLRVQAGATGATGDAAIRQAGPVAVAGSAAFSPLAVAAPGVSGPIMVAGAADFSTGLSPTTSLDAVAPGADRDVVLDNAENTFGGPISVRRIAGGAVLVEESAGPGAGSTTQEIANWEVGGSTRLTTTDALVFLGRLTALADSVAAPPRLNRPGALASHRQGEAGLATDLLRLGLVSGERFAIDTTGGGLTRGADVRFDRPVDGLNAAAPVGSVTIASERASLGALTIDAGRDGVIRFRDFVGAVNPIGAVDLRGGAFLAGLTFAEGGRPAAAAATRHLFDSAAPDDYFFSGRLRINVPGPLLAATPPGSVGGFVTSNSYFGINVSAFQFGDLVAPISAEAYGFIVNTRQRIGGLFPAPPDRGPEFQFNDCVVGDVADCTNIPLPSVINQILIVTPPVLDVDKQDLLELFGSFGNEELWGVPPSFFSDFIGIDACADDTTC